MAWNTNDKQAMKKVDDVAAQVGVEIDSLTQQLAETDEEIGNVKNELKVNVDDAYSTFVKKHETPITDNTDFKVLMTLDNNTFNYGSLSDGIIKGTSPSFERAFYRKGLKFESNEVIEIPYSASELKEGTMFLRFKTLIDFNSSLDRHYNMMKIDDASGVEIAMIQLDYTKLRDYNGMSVYLRGSGTNARLQFPINFTKGEVHSLAFKWRYSVEDAQGVMSMYLDGKLIRATNFLTNQMPINASMIRIGNQSSQNRAANSVIEDVFFTDKSLPISSILKLHRYPLKAEAVFNPNIYIPKTGVRGYERKEIPVIVLARDEETGRLWGRYQSSQTYSQLIYSDREIEVGDNFEVFKVFQNFNDHVVAVHVHKNKLIVGTRDGKIYVGDKKNGNFVEKIQFSPGRYVVNGWGITSKDNNIFIGEYGQSPVHGARLFRSVDDGETFEVIRTLSASNANHFHGVKIDPYTSYVWITWGDTTDANEYSTDNGETWNVVPTLSPSPTEEQSINIVPTEDAVYFASDARTSGAMLGVYDKKRNEFSRLAEETGKYMNNVFALFIDSRGMMWWFSTRDGSSVHNSGFYCSVDCGATPIYLEDIGHYTPVFPYQFIETERYIYLGNNRFNKVVAITEFA